MTGAQTWIGAYDLKFLIACARIATLVAKTLAAVRIRSQNANRELRFNL